VSASALPPTVDVYGIGTFGQELAGALVQGGVTVRSFIDSRRPTAPLPAPYVQVDEASFDRPVVLGICNPAVDVASLARDLEERGAHDVISPVTAAISAYRSSGIRVTNYWLTGDLGVYETDRDAIDQARELLDDDESLRIFDSVRSYRTTGDLSALPVPDPLEHQYFPTGIEFLTSNMRYVDAGSFDGDTVRALRGRGAGVSALLALEPDPANYASAVEAIDGWTGVECVAAPLALSDSTRLATFDGSGTSSAAVSEAGRITVQCVGLDDIAYGWSPSHVKMDIEGGETDALNGMRRLLADQRPRLAIATYHRPSDMWTLPNLIASLAEYRFWLRTYAAQTFETVLYAIPR
jgi:FkbM family methyltransferase